MKGYQNSFAFPNPSFLVLIKSMYTKLRVSKKHEKKQYKPNSLYVTLFDRFQIGLSTKFQ